VSQIKCSGCKRDINSGVEAQKQVQVWRTPDGGEERSFGLGAPNGNLVRNQQTNAYEIPPEGRAWAQETGARIAEVYHSKHWHHRAKREMRGGDVVTGRNLGNQGFTAYDIEVATMNRTEMEEAGLTEEDLARGTRRLQERADLIRAMAKAAGTATGDWGIKERVRLMDHDGQPYYHAHHTRLKDFQLKSHLLYAHGIQVAGQPLTEDAVVRERIELTDDPRTYHEQRHMVMAREQLEQYKSEDPGDTPAGENKNDWRDQEVLEVKDVPEVW
jgi:hypothetical protein